MSKKSRTEKAEEEKAINGVAITCTTILFLLTGLVYALPNIDDEGIKSLIEHLASPFALALIFFLIESVRDQQKQDKDTEE
ncbi:hypothetical protein H8S88_00850 [Streptococcus sp. GS001]|uniref:hypothetical protein n=1 Tax=Streptococcus sp. GS001 TaxID=2766953 RepID=UPI001F36F032|nr:hypothetical protein [Streptococcus sp. GS001]MCF4963908.1 hypothetical protein [Streptococcus sp. GS001]